jgi:hypothetical protein
MTWCNSQPVGDAEGRRMYTCLAGAAALTMYEDEYEDAIYLGKKHLLMYRQIYHVNRWLYIHHLCDEQDFSLYFFTLTSVCDLSRHYFASLLIKHKPTVEADRVYISMLGYRFIRLPECMHQIGLDDELVDEAHAMLHSIVKNVILRPVSNRVEALNTVAEIQDRFSVMVSAEDILIIRQKYSIVVDNLAYIMKNCNCGASSARRTTQHENCAILKYFS